MAKQSVIAFFFDRENAETAVLSLRRLAILDEELIISPAAAAQAGDMPAHVKRFWMLVDMLFGSSRDRHLYTEGVRRGYVMVAAQALSADVGKVAALLERHGAVDLDACETAWRSDGWTGGPAAAEARDRDGMGPLQSATHLTQQANTDRAAASVLAAASAQGAYRFRDTEAETRSAETSPADRVDRRQAETAEMRRTAAGSDRRMSLDRENSGPSQDGARVPGSASPAQRAKDLEVVCSDGQQVGILEQVEGTTMRVRFGGSAPDGTVRSIPTAWIRSIDDRVVLKVSCAELRSCSGIA